MNPLIDCDAKWASVNEELTGHGRESGLQDRVNRNAFITFFTSMDDVRAFAGEDREQAVVEDTARRAVTRWDECVTHHEVDLRR